MTTPLFQGAPQGDPSNAIFSHPLLTEEDRKMAREIYDKNIGKIQKSLKRKNVLFMEAEEEKLVKRLDLAIKAILNSRIESLGG